MTCEDSYCFLGYLHAHGPSNRVSHFLSNAPSNKLKSCENTKIMKKKNFVLILIQGNLCNLIYKKVVDIDFKKVVYFPMYHLKLFIKLTKIFKIHFTFNHIFLLSFHTFCLQNTLKKFKTWFKFLSGNLINIANCI